MSLKERYLSAKVPPVVVTIPVWGEVNIRVLTIGELKKIRESEDEQSVASLILSAVVDEHGAQVFSDPAELDAVQASVVKDLAEAIAKVNAPKVEDQKKC